MSNVGTNRRNFLKAAGVGLAAMAITGRVGRTAAAAEPWPPDVADDSPRPNILWISTEDISPTLGCYGDKYATTPNLDKFAAQGVRYELAFTHAPVCAPARSGIITGMYPTSIGTTWMRCAGVPPVEARCFPEYLRAAGYYCTNNSKTDYQFSPPGSAWDDCSGKAHWRNRPDKRQPFFAVFNITVTHESQTRSFKPGQSFEHDPAKAPVPPYYPDTQIVRENIACYYDRVSQMDKQARKILDELDADGLAENTIVWFWGDHGWGLTRGKRFLYESGLRVPLLVRVPQSLGKWAGAGDAAAVAPGRVDGEMVSFIDYAPTMLSLAGAKVPSHMHGRAFMGPQKPSRPREYVFGGRDRMDETYDFSRTVRDKKFRYIRNYTPYLPLSQPIDYMDQTPILKEMRRLHAAGKLPDGPQMQFFRPTKPVRELYDVLADPHNVNNLADDPKYAEVVKRMQQALDDWMKLIGDIGFVPESDFDAIKGPGKAATPGFSPTETVAGKIVQVAITCPTRGSSITYRVEPAGLTPPRGAKAEAAEAVEKRPAKAGKGAKAAKAGAGDGEGWLVYCRPVELKPAQAITAHAWRLGYAPSQKATYTFGEKPVAPGDADDPKTFWRERIDASGMLDRCRDIKAYDGRWADGVEAYIKALADKEAPVRYWAIVGLGQAAKADPLGGLRPALAARAMAAVAALKNDPAASVRAAVGEALCDMGKLDDGLGVLLEVATGDTGMGAAYAAWAIWRLGDKAKPILPALEQAAGPAARYAKDALAHAIDRLKK
jgi:uncharacterized sulfatase